MPSPRETVEAFADLFRGLERAYGRYDIQGKSSSGKSTGRAVTYNEPLTLSQWEDHLFGRAGLGVVPINDDNECHWGVIDVDDYTVNLEQLSNSLEPTPLILCRSKSGGAHLFVLFSTPISAKQLKAKLHEIAASLGFGGCEVFPKQTELISDRGDIGQWLNMPYFHGDKGTRYCIRNGEALSTQAFIEYARAKRVAPDDFLEFTVLKESMDDVLQEGPPCLQLLTKLGYPQGTRNQGLYNVGVYMKKAFPDDWEKKLDEYNAEFMRPPLSSTEVLTLCKSLKRRDYGYKCNEEPICSRCDRPTCLGRRYGIGGGGGGELPDMKALVKIDTRPPVYFLDVEGKRIGPLDSEDLLQQTRFKKRCMETLNMVLPTVRVRQWDTLLRELFETVFIVEMPHESSEEGVLLEYLREFCFGRMAGEEETEIHLGKAWTDPKSGMTYFKLKDFKSYLDQHRFRAFRVHEVSALLKDKGASSTTRRIEGEVTRVWSLKSDMIDA